MCAQWVAKDHNDPRFLHADSEDTDQTGRMSLPWAHIHFVGFVMSWLLCCHVGVGSFSIVITSWEEGVGIFFIFSLFRNVYNECFLSLLASLEVCN